MSQRNANSAPLVLAAQPPVLKCEMTITMNSPVWTAAFSSSNLDGKEICKKQLLAALRMTRTRRAIRVFLTADEEVGSISAKPHLVRAAEGAAAAFVVEPPTEGFRVARLLLADLFHEAGRLVLGVVQLGEAVGDLAPGDEQLEAIGDVGLLVVAPRERADLDGEVGDEGRVDEVRDLHGDRGATAEAHAEGRDGRHNHFHADYVARVTEAEAEADRTVIRSVLAPGAVGLSAQPRVVSGGDHGGVEAFGLETPVLEKAEVPPGAAARIEDSPSGRKSAAEFAAGLIAPATQPCPASSAETQESQPMLSTWTSSRQTV